MRIFVYECVSAGALGPATPPSLRREGRAMLSGIVADFDRIAQITTVTLIDGGPLLGDECVRCQDEEKQFRELAARCDYTLVIAPESDDWLLQRSNDVLDVGGRLLGSAPKAIRLTGDKLATADFWRSNRVPHPPTRRLDEMPDDFPFVIKPRFGAGSQATFLVENAHMAALCVNLALTEWAGDLLAQRYVPGDAISVSLLIGAQQVVPLMPARQHLSVDGRFHYLGGSLPLPAPQAERAVVLAKRAVAGIAGLYGYVGVDLVLGETDWAIEINPRLTTSYIGLRQLCQENLAELILHTVQGKTISLPQWFDGPIQFEA